MMRIFVNYKEMFEYESRPFDDWIRRSFLTSSILAGGLLFMALASAGLSVSPRDASADNTELSASNKLPDQGTFSAFELMSRASGQLPVQPLDEQAF